jgi:hypothetical protein
MMQRNNPSALRHLKLRQLFRCFLPSAVLMAPRFHFTAKFREVGAIAERYAERLILAG